MNSKTEFGRNAIAVQNTRYGDKIWSPDGDTLYRDADVDTHGADSNTNKRLGDTIVSPADNQTDNDESDDFLDDFSSQYTQRKKRKRTEKVLASEILATTSSGNREGSEISRGGNNQSLGPCGQDS